MQHINLRPLQHYNELIAHLGPWKMHQIILLLIMVAYWIVSGLSEAIFELTLARKFLLQLFFVEQSLQIVVIIIAVSFSVRFPRTKINICLIVVLGVGSLFYLLGALLPNETVKQVGEIMTIILHYTMSLNIMMIMLEYVQCKQYPIVWGLSLLGFTVGKVIAVILVSQKLSNIQWFLLVILPCLTLYLCSLYFVEESPRYWIDQNIGKAQKLLHKISALNKIKYEPIQHLLQRQFFWHKVTLTKYSIGSLFHYTSINFNAYVIGIQALLLGVICRCPDFIQHLRQGSSFEVDDSLEIIWVSIFQGIALIPTYLSSRIFRRKTALVVASVVLLLLTCILAVLELGDFYVGNSIIYSMTVFGLNSFFSMVFFYFLLLAAFEFFPHTIRTLSCGIMFCLYRLGKLLFSLHIETIEIPLKRNEGMMELVLCCSILILIHSFMLAQTFEQVGRYDLPEIEEKEYDEYLPA